MPGDILGPFYDCIKYISDTPHSFNPQFPQTALTLVHWIALVCTCHILPKHCCNRVPPSCKFSDSTDLYLIKNLWDVLDKIVRSMEAPPHNLQQVNDLSVASDTPTRFRGLEESRPQWVMVVLAAKEGTNTRPGRRS